MPISSAGEFDLHAGGAGRPTFPCSRPPREPIELAEYAAGIHVARTVADGGTLQLGIGSLGDAVAHALILRHRANSDFRAIAARLDPADSAPTGMRESDPFDSGPARRERDAGRGLPRPHAAPASSSARSTARCCTRRSSSARARSTARCATCRRRELAKLRMTSVLFVNELYGDEAAKRRARVKARFINNAMMATLLGAVVSDALGERAGRERRRRPIQLRRPGLRAGRRALDHHAACDPRARTGGRRSNIRWNYGHTTIPRHLRDIVVTEYGVADLRGKTDRDVIAAMLAVDRSRASRTNCCGRRRTRARSSKASSCRRRAATTPPSASRGRSRRRASRDCCRRFRSAPISPRREQRSSPALRAAAVGLAAAARRPAGDADFVIRAPRPTFATASAAWRSTIRQVRRSTSRPRC